MKFILRQKTFCNLCTILCVVILSFTSCCNSSDKCAKVVEYSPNIFPDYKNATIPYNISPLNFKIPEANKIKAIVTFKGKKIFDIIGKSTIEFPENEWKRFLGKAKGGKVEIKVCAWTTNNPEGIEYAPFYIYISNDKIDPWIAYRLIPPGYELWNRMGIYQRNLETYKQEAIIKNSQNNKGCINCHSFCNYDSKNWLFHARGEGGSTVITLNGETQKLPIEKIGPKKSATYPFWHPSGKYIAFSSNTTRQTFYGISRNKIEVFDINSDIIIYDVNKKNVITNPAFFGNQDWKTFPCFSPDGKYLYYCIAHLDIPEQQHQMMQAHFEKLKYALVRIQFDAKTGQFGSKIDTIYSPSREGGSVSFPRISPNGKFIMFTKADCATFPIQHVEADLVMKDIETGKNINTDILNSRYSDSYHSWSSNSRWIIFSSKRIDGKYTRLFISHCDSNGKFSKPFLLPQKDPEQNNTLFFAYNIPEFIKSKVVLDKEKTADMFRIKQ